MYYFLSTSIQTLLLQFIKQSLVICLIHCLMCNMPFFTICFQDYFLSLILSSLTMSVWAWFSLSSSYFGFAELLESINLCLSPNLGNLLHILYMLVIFSSPSGTPMAQVLDLLIWFHMSLFSSSSIFLLSLLQITLFLSIYLHVHWLSLLSSPLSHWAHLFYLIFYCRYCVF